MVRVAINGYGRIGRIAHRVILEKYQGEIEIVAINAGSSTDIKGWMYLLKYDSSYGPLFNHEIKFKIPNSKSSPRGEAGEINPNAQGLNVQNRNDYIGDLIIDGNEIPVFSQKDPSLLPWRDLNVDVVIESSGSFRTEEKLKAHLLAGAKKVVLSAPAKPARNASPARKDSVSGGQSDAGGEDIIQTYVLSVNDKDYKGENLISNASCTTNGITPVAKIMSDNFGILKAMMTTIHGYTSDQRLQDGGHKDYRRARAGAENIVPTTTGATLAAAKALPKLEGIFSGLAIRVPVAVGSLADFTFLLAKNTTREEVNEIFRKEAESSAYKGIVSVTEDPIVSSDIIGNSASAIVDLSLTQVVSENLVKVIAWYDNEYGYANRLVEEVLMIGR